VYKLFRPPDNSKQQRKFSHNFYSIATKIKKRKLAGTRQSSQVLLIDIKSPASPYCAKKKKKYQHEAINFRKIPFKTMEENQEEKNIYATNFLTIIAKKHKQWSACNTELIIAGLLAQSKLNLVKVYILGNCNL
jgi:hypothetical protein